MCQIEIVEGLKRGRPSLEQVTRIGVDTSKNVFQLHGVNAEEKAANVSSHRLLSGAPGKMRGDKSRDIRIGANGVPAPRCLIPGENQPHTLSLSPIPDKIAGWDTESYAGTTLKPDASETSLARSYKQTAIAL
jgi:hypothetical protein